MRPYSTKMISVILEQFQLVDNKVWGCALVIIWHTDSPNLPTIPSLNHPHTWSITNSTADPLTCQVTFTHPIPTYTVTPSFIGGGGCVFIPPPPFFYSRLLRANPNLFSKNYFCNIREILIVWWYLFSKNYFCNIREILFVR